MKRTYCKADLSTFQPQHHFFIGMDSDGCVFDSMAIKQIKFFQPEIIRIWGLETQAERVCQIAEWLSLYSPWRGLNRFQLLLKIFQTLGNYVDPHNKDPDLEESPSYFALEKFVNSGVPLSADELSKRIEETRDLELQKVLDWSLTVSANIAQGAGMPLFDGVFQGLEKLKTVADIVVVSQTTEDALIREWHHAGVDRFADGVAGAELGSKAESITRATKGRYAPEQILMVGDAPGDLEASRETGCLFYPIVPGHEVSSWIELREKAIDRFLNGTFSGTYQDDLIHRFHAALSKTPPWL